MTLTRTAPYIGWTLPTNCIGRGCRVYQGPTKRRHTGKRQAILGRGRRRNTFSKVFKKLPDGNTMNMRRYGEDDIKDYIQSELKIVNDCASLSFLPGAHK